MKDALPLACAIVAGILYLTAALLPDRFPARDRAGWLGCAFLTAFLFFFKS